MKKLTLLILLVLVASLLVAAIPTKTVRLVIINKSSYDVYMKLEGSALTGGFYYLTIPAGDPSCSDRCFGHFRIVSMEHRRFRIRDRLEYRLDY
jgi:predicted small secreted protein